MNTVKINAIDSQTLLSLELPPTRFIVERLLPQGFHILAGKAKTGKSWLLLSLCLQIANGEPFWEYQTEKGSVLYLCLEDNYNRIQERLLELADSAPANLYLSNTAVTMEENLSAQLESFIEEHPDTVLIVIDTLQKIRDPAVDKNSYAQDYKDISYLKRIADKHGIAIIGVQHLRKQSDSDPHQMISGSTGLVGAADGSYVLKRSKDSDTEARLFIRGRDVEERVLSIDFDKEKMRWEFLSSSSPEAESMLEDKTMQRLITFINAEKDFSGTASELAEKLNGSVKANSLTRKLNQNEKALRAIGIEFSKTRSGERRELHIFRHTSMTI